MDIILLGKCGCIEEHSTGDCYTRDCILKRGKMKTAVIFHPRRDGDYSDFVFY